MLLSRPSYVINGSLESLVTPALCNTPIPIPNRSSSRARFGTLVYGSPSPIHCKYIVIIIASGREPAINLGKATHLEMDWQINLRAQNAVYMETIWWSPKEVLIYGYDSFLAFQCLARPMQW